MLETVDAYGFVTYWNNLISFVILAGSLTWACRELQKPRKDLGLHYFVCALVTFIVLTFLSIIGLKSLWWLAPVVAMLVGVGKEVADYFNPKKRLFDPKDLLGDFIGTAAVTLVYIFSWLLHDPSK